MQFFYLHQGDSATTLRRRDVLAFRVTGKITKSEGYRSDTKDLAPDLDHDELTAGEKGQIREAISQDIFGQQWSITRVRQPVEALPDLRTIVY